MNTNNETINETIKRPTLLKILCILCMTGVVFQLGYILYLWWQLGSALLWKGLWTTAALTIALRGWWGVWKMQRSGLLILLALLTINLIISAMTGAIRVEFTSLIASYAFYCFMFWRYWEKMAD